MAKKKSRTRSQVNRKKKLNHLASNQQALQAIVLTGEEIVKQVSNALGDSDIPTSGSSARGDVIDPPLPLEILAKLPENSTELVQVIEAMEINIEGFGQRVVNSREMDEAEVTKFQIEMKKEKAELDALLEVTNAEDDLTELRKKTRKDIETTGNGYWELLTSSIDPNILLGIQHVKSKTIKLTKQDKDFTQVRKRWLNENFEWEEKLFFKKFRRFVQQSGAKTVYFKEWDDPRIIDKRTGEPATGRLQKKNRATPMVWFNIYSGAHTYGMPRLIGNFFSIWGSRAADQINFTTFKNNNVPSMIITVSNGQLTEGSIERVEDFVNSQIKRSDNMSKFLILEGESQEEDATINPGAMKIGIEKMTDTQRDDQLFQNYDKNNADKIRRAFRLPPIFVGKAEDFNKATAETSRRLADEQVFAPERQRMDRKINEVLKQFGFKFWKIKSNSPNVTDDEILVKMLAGIEKTGGATPRIARSIMEDVFGRELPGFDSKKFDPDIPFSLTIAEAVKKQDGLVNNQGQMPKAENAPGDEETEKIMKTIDGIFDSIDEVTGVNDVGIFGEKESDDA